MNMVEDIVMRGKVLASVESSLINPIRFFLVSVLWKYSCDPLV